MSKPAPKRFRISVPLHDELVLNWINSQYNLSMSLRQMIKNQISVSGYQDIFATDPEMVTVPAGLTHVTPVGEVTATVAQTPEVKVETPSAPKSAQDDASAAKAARLKFYT